MNTLANGTVDKFDPSVAMLVGMTLALPSYVEVLWSMPFRISATLHRTALFIIEPLLARVSSFSVVSTILSKRLFTGQAFSIPTDFKGKKLSI